MIYKELSQFNSHLNTASTNHLINCLFYKFHCDNFILDNQMNKSCSQVTIQSMKNLF